MTDDRTRGLQPERIDTGDEAQLQRWAQELDVTAEQIKEAVQAVGDLAPDVEMHLKGSRASTNADLEARAEDASGPA